MNGDCDGVRPALPIAHRIREAIRAPEIRIRRIRHRPIGIDQDRPAGPLSHASHRERIAVHIRIVGQHGDRDRRDRIRLGAVRVGYGRVVDRVDRHRDRSRIGPALPVANPIREAVRAPEIRIRGIRHRPVGIDHDHPVAPLGNADHRDRIVVRIAIVGQHGEGDRRVLVSNRRIVRSIRRPVDHRYVDHSEHLGVAADRSVHAGGSRDGMKILRPTGRSLRNHGPRDEAQRGPRRQLPGVRRAVPVRV